MPLDNKCRIGPLAGIHRDSSLKMTRLTLQVARGRAKIQSTLPMKCIPTEVAADMSIRPTCFSEAYYTAPIKSAARTAAG
ncbi:hypothetical protein TNCV_2831981 [Trichonephila clavipes]|nr:hypothetical protein TNCV_2831981 [Trichonephila clavipes]